MFLMNMFGWDRVSVSRAKRKALSYSRGAGEVQKKYSRKGKLNENKFLHAS